MSTAIFSSPGNVESRAEGLGVQRKEPNADELMKSALKNMDKDTH